MARKSSKIGFQRLSKAARSEMARKGGLARAEKAAAERRAEARAAKKSAAKKAAKKASRRRSK